MSMSALFDIAGWSFAVSFVFSVLLGARLRGDPITDELFAIPYRGLGRDAGSSSPRLLRARYFLPWTPSPASLAEHPLSTRAIFWIARIAGATFACAMLAFLTLTFVA
jgi:hypothetical protein